MQYLDQARYLQLNFQDPATPSAEGIIDLHHNIFFILLSIISIVTYLMFSILKDTSYIWIKPTKIHIKRQKTYLKFNSLIHGTFLEIVWTIIPSIVLFIIAIPSFSLLYAMEEILDPQITVKTIANQWYWSYEYGNLDLAYDSYLIHEKDLTLGEPRLLTVDHSLFLPVETNIRLLITSRDVIHSFAVPSLGLKVDAVPGRLNQLSTFINRTGTFYGQCSELCGVNHGFMPIEINALLMQPNSNIDINLP